MIEFSGRAKFVRDIGKELGLQFGGAAQVVGALVEFRIECDHTAVCVLKFAVQQFQFFLPRAQFLECLQQFLVLLFDLFVGAFGRSRPASSG